VKDQRLEITDIVKHIDDATLGKLGVPEFHRKFVCTPEKINKFVDSLARLVTPHRARAWDYYATCATFGQPMPIVLLMASLLPGQMLGLSDAGAKAKAQALASEIEKCSPRVVVAKTSKHGWSKGTWGPPINADFDVLKTNSIIWPYQIVISFTIPFSNSESHKNRDEAEQDTKPALEFQFSYKNVYEIKDDGGIRLSQTLHLPLSVTGKSGWEERQRLPDACCDHLAKTERGRGRSLGYRLGCCAGFIG